MGGLQGINGIFNENGNLTMANTKSGYIRKITPIQEIVGKSGKTFTKRTLVLDAARYDQNTGEKMFDNYPSFEFSGDGMKILDNFKEGDAVTVSYDINGREFKDEQTGEVKYFNSIRGYKVECYGGVEAKAQQAPVPDTNNPQQTAVPAAQEQDDEEKSDLPF